MSSIDVLEKFLEQHATCEIVPKLSNSKGKIFWEKLKERLTDPKQLKYIVVGDNPGKTEYDEQGYFLGSTRHIRNFMRCFVSEDEVLYFNKTPFYTPNTTTLTKVSQNNTKVFDESQKLMANCLAEMALNSNAEIWIVGFSHFVEKEKLNSNFFPKNKFFITFQKTLNDELKKHPTLGKKIYTFAHPSHNGIAADVYKIVVYQKGKFILDKFKELGKNRAQEYFDI